MDSKLEARLEKIENRLDALWRATMRNSVDPSNKISDDCIITFKEEDKGFEINKWYKATDNNHFLAFITEYKGMRGNIGYGFDRNGDWRDWNGDITYGLYDCILASEEEVKEALIKEAERRYGKIKLGMNFKGHWNEKTVLMIDKEDWYYDDRLGVVLGKNATALMVDGKWAEIVHDEIKKGDKYYHNIYYNLKAVAIENKEKERFEAVVISEDKNCASEGFKIGKITECWLNEWTKVEN